jgi:hypothetical protein
MMERPIDVRWNVLGGESRQQTLVRLFGRCPRKTEKLIAVWPHVSAESFLDVRRDRLGRFTDLPRVRQATLEESVNVVHHHSGGVEHA